MKRYISLALTLFVYTAVLSAAESQTPVTVLKSDSQHLLIKVTTDSLSIRPVYMKGVLFHQLSLPGGVVTTEEGKPQIPFRGMMVGIPVSAEVTAAVVKYDFTEKPNYNVVPVRKLSFDPTSEIGSFQTQEDFLDKAFYDQDLWYPQQLVKLGSTGFIRDQRVAQLEVYPVQFNPALKRIKIYRSLTIQLTFQNVFEPESRSSVPVIAASGSPFETTLASLLPNYETAKVWRKSIPSLAKTLDESSSPSFKVYVDEDGIYRITGRDLEKAGASLSQLDPRTLKLFSRGQEIPMYVSGEGDGKLEAGDYIEFYGQFNRGEKSYYSPYSLSNVYWLSWGGSKGLRTAEVDGGLYESDIASPEFYKATEHVEQDRTFDRLLLVPDESSDHWFWQVMNADHTYEFKFNLQQPHATADLATVRVKLHGSTHPAAYPDHHTIIHLNGYLIEDATWDGQTEHFIERRDIPNSVLKDGENVLSVELPGDTQAGEVDQVLFNWCEVEYWRPFEAVDDFIEIKGVQASGVVQFSVNGFSSEQITVLDNRGRRLANFDVVKKGDTYTVIFQDQVYSSNLPLTYYVFTPKATKKPAQIVKDDPSELKASRNGADYIIITHEQFLNAIIPLANHRTTQGYRVKIVEIQDIYDEFGYGIYDPWAIQRFLRYAYEHWQPPAPLYVLLVGDTSWGYDTQAARSWGTPSYVPTVMRYTISWGITSSDNTFAGK